MLLLTLRGTPTLYQGDELGLSEVEITPDRQVDPWGLQAPGLGRDGCRTPMPWGASLNAGFTEGEPWLPLGPEAKTRHVAAQVDDPASVLNLYRTLLRYRREMPSLHRGSYRRMMAPDGVFAYRREASGSPAVDVVLNCTSEQREIDIVGEIVLSTEMDRSERRVGGGLVLQPKEGIVVVRPAG